MVEITCSEFNTITEAEIKSVLRRKFLRIRLGERVYCFRILQVKEILDGKNCVLEVKQGFEDYENVYGFMRYDEERIPIFDLDYEYTPGESRNFACSSVIIMDVISDGFILQLGVLVDRVYDILHAIMSEISEKILSGRVGGKENRNSEPRP